MNSNFMLGFKIVKFPRIPPAEQKSYFKFKFQICYLFSFILFQAKPNQPKLKVLSLNAIRPENE